MSTIKHYTDLSQSKVLAEILSLKSADGFWEYHDKWFSEGDEWEGYEDYPRAEPYLNYSRKENEWKQEKSDIPCWSLTALLDVLPSGYVIVKNHHSFYYAESRDHKKSTHIFNNPIDACVEMILKLHEQNFL